jgi:CubicO group peptidase (beta-lactamase class C family)
VKCAVVVVLFAALGCRSSNVQTEITPVDGSAPAVAIADASLAALRLAAAGDAEAGAPELVPARPLPSAQRLIAPFQGTTAHGFVAMTNVDRAVAVDARRTIASLSAGDPLDGARPVLVASFTKLWTAVAALRMVERGELSLDETVKDALPELATRPWSSSTVRELLTHTSLVPELDEKGGGYFRRTDVDFTSPVAVLAKHVPQDWTEKRGIFKYRNAELALVGAILAVRAKTTAERVLTREVFEPSGMTHAGLLVTTGPPALDLRPMGAVRPQNFFTAGAGYASASDLLAFFEALAGTDLLRASSKEILFEGDVKRGHGALGCWAYPFAGPDGGTTRLVERPGSFGNVRLFTAFFPDVGRAIVAWNGDGIEIARPRTAKGIGHSLARIALE